MARECAICGDTQCLNLVEDPNIKDNICCICMGLEARKACNMCQLRLPDNHKHTIGIYMGVLLILLLIAIMIIIFIVPSISGFGPGPFDSCNNQKLICW